MNILSRFPKVAADGMPARLFLAFLATAGLFYVNIMPAIVSGLIEALDFSSREAGWIASANVYGAAVGALLIVTIVRRIRWQPVCLALLAALIVIDLASITISTPGVLLPVRFVHGCVGGMLVGTGLSVMARTAEPDRSFGMLLVVQYGLGGLGVMLIPGLVPMFGTAVLFLSLVGFSALTGLMLLFLPLYPLDRISNPGGSAPIRSGTRLIPLLLTLLALFLFQAANMGLYAFIIGLGQHFGLGLPFISGTLGVAAWLGLVGAGLVVAFSDRWGYFGSLFAGMLFTLLGTWLLYFSNVPWIWVVANCLVGITWAWTVAYLFGLMARFDRTGQMAALGGFASKMGLASGPAMAALLLGDDDYPRLVGVALAALVVSLLAVMHPARHAVK